MRQLIDLGNARYAVDALVAFVDARYDKVLGNLHGNAVSEASSGLSACFELTAAI